MNNNDSGFMFLVGIPLILLIAGIIYVFSTTTEEGRHEAAIAKYYIKVGMSGYYVNSYTYSNNCLTFHDTLRDADETFVNKSFTVKNNQE